MPPGPGVLALAAAVLLACEGKLVKEQVVLGTPLPWSWPGAGLGGQDDGICSLFLCEGRGPVNQIYFL